MNCSCGHSRLEHGRACEYSDGYMHCHCPAFKPVEADHGVKYTEAEAATENDELLSVEEVLHMVAYSGYLEGVGNKPAGYGDKCAEVQAKYLKREYMAQPPLLDEKELDRILDWVSPCMCQFTAGFSWKPGTPCTCARSKAKAAILEWAKGKQPKQEQE